MPSLTPWSDSQGNSRYQRIWRTASLLIVEETVQRGEGVVNLLVQRVAAQPLMT